MSKAIKLTQSFHIDPHFFQPGQRVLIGYQTSAIVVLPPVASQLQCDLMIQYAKISDGTVGNVAKLHFPKNVFREAHVVLVLSNVGEVFVLKDPERAVPCDGHVAVTPVEGTLWEHYQAGMLPTVDLNFHLDFVEMRTIAQAVLSEGPTMMAVCRVLGVTRHCLRRRLTKHGMPELSTWRKSSNWQPGLAVFAHGGNQEVSEERSGDPGEQLESTAPVMTTPIEVLDQVVSGPARVLDEPHDMLGTVIPLRGGY